MTDLAYTIAQTDLSNATKQQLKNFVKAIRESWGKMIDLRKASANALRQYLEDYLTSQTTENEPVTPTPEVATLIIEESTTVDEAPAVESEDFEIVFCDGCAHRCELVTDTNVMIEASSDVTTWITLLYAGTPELAARRVADTNLITWLFPAFSGDWERLREQIAYRVTVSDTEYYGCERCDHEVCRRYRSDLYQDILPNQLWLRRVEDDEVTIFHELSEFEGIAAWV